MEEGAAHFDLLTPEEVADPRRKAKETRAWFKQTFARLRPKKEEGH